MVPYRQKPEEGEDAAAKKEATKEEVRFFC